MITKEKERCGKNIYRGTTIGGLDTHSFYSILSTSGMLKDLSGGVATGIY